MINSEKKETVNGDRTIITIILQRSYCDAYSRLNFKGKAATAK